MTEDSKTDQPGVAASIWIEAPPSVVWAEMATIDALARFSPETTATEWSAGFQHHQAGARFRGHNRNSRAEWSTECTIVTYDEPKTFAFDVEQQGDGSYATRWTYDLEPDRNGTRLTERFHSPSLEMPRSEMDPDRAAVMKAMLETTLRDVKATIERM